MQLYYQYMPREDASCYEDDLATGKIGAIGVFSEKPSTPLAKRRTVTRQQLVDLVGEDRLENLETRILQGRG